MERFRVFFNQESRLVGPEAEGFLTRMDVGPNLEYEIARGIVNKYQIVEYGATQQVIINENRKIVSKPYMEFKRHIHERFNFLVGSNGAKQHILIPPPASFYAFSEANTIPFHRIQYREDLGSLVIWLGSEQYLIDNYGQILSEGYQKILPARVHGLRRFGDEYLVEQVR